MFNSDYWPESPICLSLFLSAAPKLELPTTKGTGLGRAQAQMITPLTL